MTTLPSSTLNLSKGELLTWCKAPNKGLKAPTSLACWPNHPLAEITSCGLWKHTTLRLTDAQVRVLQLPPSTEPLLLETRGGPPSIAHLHEQYRLVILPLNLKVWLLELAHKQQRRQLWILIIQAYTAPSRGEGLAQEMSWAVASSSEKLCLRQ